MSLEELSEELSFKYAHQAGSYAGVLAAIAMTASLERDSRAMQSISKIAIDVLTLHGDGHLVSHLTKERT